MPTTALSRRLTRISARIDPAPDGACLAYARAVIAWSGGEPDEAAALRLARDLAGTRGGATWEGLVELAGRSDDGLPPDGGTSGPSRRGPLPA